MSKKINNAVKEQAERLKKAVQRLLNPQPKTPGFALQPVRNHNRLPRY